MKNIIDALTSSYSLEGEFEVQKSVNFIENMEDIELLKPYAIKLLQTNAKQAHFISSSIEVISQQAAYIFKLEKQLNKKKATLWSALGLLYLERSRGLTDYIAYLLSLWDY